MEVIGVAVQALSKPNAATLIGSGKVMEVAEMVKNMEADMVIFNDELTGMQLRNLEDSLNVKVIDRTILILDIFAERADSAEGKLQVELAQLKYRMPRLTGFGKALSQEINHILNYCYEELEWGELIQLSNELLDIEKKSSK